MAVVVMVGEGVGKMVVVWRVCEGGVTVVVVAYP